MQAYSDPKRENEPLALPDVEVFEITATDLMDGEWMDEQGSQLPEGWYWWACFPGCLPDGDPYGPFATEAEALADAQENAEEEE